MQIRSPIIFSMVASLFFICPADAHSILTTVEAKLQSKSFEPIAGTCGLKRFTLESTPEAQGGPMTCFNWQNKNTFNFKTKKIEDNAFPGIDPFCSTYAGK